MAGAVPGCEEAEEGPWAPALEVGGIPEAQVPISPSFLIIFRSLISHSLIQLLHSYLGAYLLSMVLSGTLKLRQRHNHMYIYIYPV